MRYGTRKNLEQAITLEDHKRMTAELGRPLTDNPVGHWTQAKRETDAILSSLHKPVDTDHTEKLEAALRQANDRRVKCGTVEGWRAHTERNEWPCQRCRDARRRDRADQQPPPPAAEGGA